MKCWVCENKADYKHIKGNDLYCEECVLNSDLLPLNALIKLNKKKNDK